MRNTKVRNKGFFVKSFTLAEVMLTALFLSVVVSALLASFVACFLLNEANRNQSISTTHAQYVMEEIKDSASTANGFNNLRTVVPTQWNWSVSNDFTSRGFSYLDSERITVTFTDALTGAAPTAASKLLDVVVSVSWLDRARNKNMLLETLINEP